MGSVSHRNSAGFTPPTPAAWGSIWFANSSGNLAELMPGTVGQLLRTGGAGANPSWVDAPSGGSGTSLQFDVTSATYGAVGDGVTNDRQAIQDAIDAANAAGGGVVYLPGKTFLCERDGANNHVFLLDNYHNIEFRGEGSSTVIKTGTLSTSTLHMFQIEGDSTNIVFRDFTADGGFTITDSTAGTTEQTHYIRIGSGNLARSSGQRVRIHNVDFKDVRGDCINIIGTNNGVGGLSATTDVQISNCSFDTARRSGIAAQRQAWFVTCTNCIFKNINDQDIDFEPTGNGENVGWIFDSNIFDHSLKGGNISVTFTGVGAASERHRQSVFSNNVIYNGKFNALNIANCIIDGNIMYVDTSSASEAVINLSRGVDDITISNNIIVNRRATTGYSTLPALDPGAHCISIESNGGVNPRGIHITGNTVMQGHDKNGVKIDAADDLVCSDNRIVFMKSSTNTNIGIDYNASAHTPVGFSIETNEISGDQAYAELRTKTYATTTLSETGNFIDGETVVIGSETYTAKTALTPVANEFLIGASIADSMNNLGRCVTEGGGNGVIYAASTVANADCWADKSYTNDDLIVVARVPGTAANSLATTETCANASFPGATMNSGTPGTQLGTTLDTIIRARLPGSAANSIRLALVGDGTGVGDFTASSLDLTYHYEPGVTTISDFVARLRSDAQSNGLLVVEDTTEALGTLASVLVAGDAFGLTSLSGGGGSVQYNIKVGNGSNAVDQGVIIGNRCRGAGTSSLHFSGTVTNHPVCGLNYFPDGITGMANVVALRTGGNSDRPHLVCTGTPEGQVTAPVGSTCTRTDGGAGTTLYVKESGTGNTGWIAK